MLYVINTHNRIARYYLLTIRQRIARDASTLDSRWSGRNLDVKLRLQRCKGPTTYPLGAEALELEVEYHPVVSLGILVEIAFVVHEMLV